MINPQHIFPSLQEYISAFKHPKVFKFLHVPLQSGNDHILGKMERCYTADEFKKIVRAFQSEIPQICLSTDVICGFPGETEKEFNEFIDRVKNRQ